MLKLEGDALVSFQEIYTTPVAKTGEVEGINTNQNKDARPEVFVNAEKYVNEHPKEFSEISDATQKINRAIYLQSMGKIKFQGKK